MSITVWCHIAMQNHPFRGHKDSKKCSIQCIARFFIFKCQTKQYKVNWFVISKLMSATLCRYWLTTWMLTPENILGWVVLKHTFSNENVFFYFDLYKNNLYYVLFYLDCNNFCVVLQYFYCNLNKNMKLLQSNEKKTTFHQKMLQSK